VEWRVEERKERERKKGKSTPNMGTGVSPIAGSSGRSFHLIVSHVSTSFPPSPFEGINNK
jgi:hypothetical protein